MATTTPTITSDWTLLVAAGQEFILTTLRTGHPVEIAISDTAVAPTIAVGHLVAPGEGITRTLIGPGYVYARKNDPAYASYTVVLTTWP